MPRGKNNTVKRTDSRTTSSLSSDTPTRIKLLYDDEPFDANSPSISYYELQDLINLPRSLINETPQ